jgi:hypothetical protein
MDDIFTTHYLADNLHTALRVAGPKNKDGTPGPLHAVALQKSTGIARSTLRSLKSARASSGFNADLRTMARLAQALGIPLAFLFMRPADWKALAKAIADVATFTPVAESMLAQQQLATTDMVERLLSVHGVYPERPPRGVPTNQEELDQLAGRNEARRKVIHVLGALMLPMSRNQREQALFAALAAALANHAELPASTPAGTVAV